MQTYLKEIDYLVAQEEATGREIAKNVLRSYFKENSVKEFEIIDAQITSSVDIKGYCDWGKELYFNCEVKQRFKTPEQLQKYNWVELKREKLQRMIKEAKGQILIYCVILNNTDVFLFNLKEIDWSNIPREDWWIKDKQVDVRSGYSHYTTYQIPFEKCFYHYSLAN